MGFYVHPSACSVACLLMNHGAVQVSSERAELARKLNEQQALLEEEKHSKKKLRKKLTKKLEELEREAAQLQQKLEEK